MSPNPQENPQESFRTVSMRPYTHDYSVIIIVLKVIHVSLVNQSYFTLSYRVTSFLFVLNPFRTNMGNNFKILGKVCGWVMTFVTKCYIWVSGVEKN